MGCARWLALGGLLALAGLLQARLLLPQQEGFGECDRFFYAGTPPAGLGTEAHVRICQRFAGSERFATLYSPGHRIPVFSAFRAARPASRSAEQRGLLEPQVSRAPPPWDLRFRFTLVSPPNPPSCSRPCPHGSLHLSRRGGRFPREMALPPLWRSRLQCLVGFLGSRENMDWETAPWWPRPGRSAGSTSFPGPPTSPQQHWGGGQVHPILQESAPGKEGEGACRRPPSWS